ncbi:hemolysin family protein [Sciscionella sediminilitoris]|uniref:hemolysin family protein n=1 Tax=Sciscionella sediminilitoris TaxID=1445613 RepID=UPI0004DF8D8E|nr:hemolysin family protein [Sciscionella sp. SE31]
MFTALITVLLGVLVVVLVTALTGYFVAQEFAYMAVDRSGLTVRANAGDAGARRALRITRRTSFLLSGAQLGITVTGLLVGYAAEPLIGEGLGTLLGGAGVAPAAGIAVGTVFALVFSTVVQMVLGELVPKNLAIARPEPLARRLAWSTGLYLAVFGWLIWLFDRAASLLLKAVRIEPVHDVEHAATARDLEGIVAASRANGDLPAELSGLLERTLDLYGRTAGHAMIPRTRLVTIRAEQPVAEAYALMAAGHSRLPVLGEDVDDVRGLLCLRAVLELEPDRAVTTLAGELATPALVVPSLLTLPTVLDRLRSTGNELACVVDEYGGLAGVITVEDIAEELLGEIADEHDSTEADRITRAGDAWSLPGTAHIDEVERLLEHRLPRGDYETVAGLVMASLQRLPETGDTVTLALPARPGAEEPAGHLVVTVDALDRRVPGRVSLSHYPAEHS